MTASCGSCGRPLRDPVSRAAGLGPVCRRNLQPTPAERIRAVELAPTPGPGQTVIPIPPDQLALWSSAALSARLYPIPGPSSLETPR